MTEDMPGGRPPTRREVRAAEEAARRARAGAQQTPSAQPGVPAPPDADAGAPGSAGAVSAASASESRRPSRGRRDAVADAMPPTQAISVPPVAHPADASTPVASRPAQATARPAQATARPPEAPVRRPAFESLLTPGAAPEPPVSPRSGGAPGRGDARPSDEDATRIFTPAGAAADTPLAWRQLNFGTADEDERGVRRTKRRRRGVRPLIVTIVVIAILAALGAGGYSLFAPDVNKLVASMQPNDYKGDGHGEVDITIKNGDIGSNIATTLKDKGVTKTFAAFYQLLLAQHPEPDFQPGVYRMAKEMSAKSALARLEDPSSRLDNTAVIPEGELSSQIYQILSTATKIPVAEFQSAAASPQQYGLPAQAKTLEGYLFPATYTFNPGTSAHDILQQMVTRAQQAFTADGVPAANQYNTVILASIVQKEAGIASDFPKVARVFQNRLNIGMDLQSDATVAYGTGHTNTVTTTDAEREDASDPYNTYVHAGLPPGPISNPGDIALKAAVDPTPGPWLFFVTVNLKTGETVFSTTEAQHEVAVQQFQAWLRQNPGYN